MVLRAELLHRFKEFSQTTSARAPLYSLLAAHIGDDPELAGLLEAAPDEQQIPVLLFAAVHFMLLAGEGPRLAAFYPNLTERAEVGDAFREFRSFASDHAEELRSIIATHRTQTNEVGRCALFLPVFALLEAEVGPIAQLDVGASAGLNLLWDAYSYEYSSGGRLGVASSVHLQCIDRGGVPVPAMMPRRARSLGLDLEPLDLADDQSVRWLEACVWPDQADRFALLVAAIGLARAAPPEIRRADAVTAVGTLVAELASSGHATVTTSWVLNYLSATQRLDFVAALDAAGSRADFSWVCVESPAQTVGLPIPTTAEPEHATVVSLVRWRHGERTVTRLATAHPHGYWLDWRLPAG